MKILDKISWSSLAMPCAALFFSAIVAGMAAPSIAAAPSQQTRILVDTSRVTLETFLSDPENNAFRDLLKKAEGILIFPQKIKGAFVLGAKGGNGILLVRDRRSDTWNGPAFYTMGGISIDLQAGGSVSEVILLIMTQRGIASLMASSIKLGAHVSVAAGPVGGGVSAETANLSADILSFAKAKGVYGGVSLSGAVVSVRSGMNRAYYGRQVANADILILRSITSPHSREIISLVTSAAR